jgi:FecR-like protein
MFDTIRFCVALIVLGIAGALYLRPEAFAEDAAWRVAKLSGEGLVVASGHDSSLSEGVLLRPGDTVRTGPSGQVLLKRGLETILVSPNSVLGLSAQDNSKLWTTIFQQAGSILLEVEKRNVKHFAVETPYLTAVVKGTQFRVTAERSDSRVDVFRGLVEVHDLKSGQYAMVGPGQAAMASARQEGAGLFLSGSGAFSPIQQGAARGSFVSPAGHDEEAHRAPGSSTERPVRLASSMTIPVSTWTPPLSAYLEPDWSLKLTDYVTSFLKSKSGGHQNHREDLELAIIVASITFFAVSIVIGIQQRRKRAKPQTKKKQDADESLVPTARMNQITMRQPVRSTPNA